MNELKEKENQLSAELQNHIAGLNQWRDGEQSRVNQETQALRAQYERDVQALRAQVEAEGLIPAVAQPAKPNGHSTSTNGNSNYLTREEANKILREEMTKAALLQGMTVNLVERHRQLFGTTPNVQELMDVATRTGRSLGEVWYEKHNVAAKEEELQKSAIQKQIDEGIREGLTKALADGAMSQQNFGGRQSDPSPIRQMLAAKRAEEAAGNSPLAIPQPVMQQSEGVRLAVEALNSGRFENKRPGQ
jgi:hypothetical protein